MKFGIFARLGALAALLAVVVAGCGGSSGSDGSTAELSRAHVELSHAQFVKKGNAICKAQAEKRNAILKSAIAGKDQSKLLPLAEREELVLRILPYYAEVPGKLEALGIPKRDEKQVEAIVAAMEQAVKNVEADPLKSLETTSQFYEASKLSAEYGLSECVV